MPPSDRLDQAFNLTLILKGVDGLLEIIGGFWLLLLSPATINRWAAVLTQHELSEDPRDWIAHHILQSAHHLQGRSLVFGAVYLLSHGLVKIVLVVALLRRRLWAYPWMMAFLLIFILYQIYRLAIDPTFGMAALTAFDILVVALTWVEYGRRRHHTA